PRVLRGFLGWHRQQHEHLRVRLHGRERKLDPEGCAAPWHAEATAERVLLAQWCAGRLAGGHSWNQTAATVMPGAGPRERRSRRARRGRVQARLPRVKPSRGAQCRGARSRGYGPGPAGQLVRLQVALDLPFITVSPQFGAGGSGEQGPMNVFTAGG